MHPVSEWNLLTMRCLRVSNSRSEGIEPPRVCRRLQLLSKVEHHEQDNEQVFSSRTCGSPEVRERAVRMVLDNQGQHGSRWQAVLSISSKIGCAPQTLNEWVNKAEVDSGKRAGVSSEMAEKMKVLERENRELRQANEILRKASAYFAMAELDRRSK
jgi:transposase